MKFDQEYWEKLDKDIPGWMSKNEAEFLIENLHGDKYLEIGVAFGKSLRLVRHHYKGSVSGLDKINHGVHDQVEDVEVQYGDSTKFGGAIDTLFIDGDHTYKGCLADFVHWYDYVTPGGRIIFHDYMRDGNHIGVTETVDAIKPLLEDHVTTRAIWCGTKPN